MLRFFLCVLTISAALSTAAAQEESPVSPLFLTPGQVDLTKILPAPPTPASKAQRKDMAISLAWEVRRTPGMEALAKADSDRSVFRFGVIFGDSFAKDRLPVAARFFDEVAGDEAVVGAGATTYR